jgi:hypothetical protein
MSKIGAILAVVLLLVTTPSYAAKHFKVFVFAGAEEPGGSFLGELVSARLADSVTDIRRRIPRRQMPYVDWLVLTNTRADAAILVQVVGREELDGEYRVHVHVTIGDREADLTGSSTHQWKKSAEQIVEQLTNWVEAHQANQKKTHAQAK